MRRLAAAVSVVLLSALALTACGGSGSGATAGSTLPVEKIAITFHGSDVTPNGTDIDVKVGQPLEFDVTADKPGEIHVHSSPEEQEFEYKAGTSTFQVKPVPAPSQVVVESHTLDKTLFTLVAR
jgi:ABC-type glycerol-3-phosphate transport system substrate-binding protein